MRGHGEPDVVLSHSVHTLRVVVRDIQCGSDEFLTQTDPGVIVSYHVVAVCYRLTTGRGARWSRLK